MDSAIVTTYYSLFLVEKFLSAHIFFLPASWLYKVISLGSHLVFLHTSAYGVRVRLCHHHSLHVLPAARGHDGSPARGFSELGISSLIEPHVMFSGLFSTLTPHQQGFRKDSPALLQPSRTSALLALRLCYPFVSACTGAIILSGCLSMLAMDAGPSSMAGPWQELLPERILL